MSRNQDGFTLTELLVVIVVTGVILLAIAGFVVENLQQSAIANERANLYVQTQQSLDLIANDIRQSANADTANRWADINSPAGSSNQYSWASNSSTLILATAAQNTSGNIIFSDQKNYITQKNNQIYFVKNNTLYKRLIAASVAGNTVKTSCPANLATASCPKDRELLNNVTLFTVTYLDSQNVPVAPSNANSVELRVKAGRTIFGKPIIADYTTRMVFRN